MAADGDKVYIAWTRFDEYGVKDPSCRTHIILARSDDGAKTFAMPRPISDSPGDCIDSDNAVEGAVPAIGVDGRVHVVWAGPRGIIHDSSKDGATWSAPVRVNDDAVKNGAVQFFTWMAVDPSDGSVNVLFYDRRNRAGTRSGVTLARSTDGGGKVILSAAIFDFS